MTHRAIIDSNHPALPGHFPGNPIVPGVVILDHVIAAATEDGYRVSAIGSAKFLSPLLAQQPILISFNAKGGRLQFEVRRDAELLAQGSLEVEPATS